MLTDHRLQRLSPQDHAAIHDAAKAHARVLRREAIDALWAAIERRLRQALQAARLAVTRATRHRPHDSPHDPPHDLSHRPPHRPSHHHHHGKT